VTLTPQPGDFQLVPTAGIGGKLIELGQWLNGDGICPYEHVRIYVGGNEFVEAEPQAARLARYPLDLGMWSTGIIPLTNAQRSAITAAARGYVGTPYSGLDYMALVLHRLHIPAPGLQAYISSTGHMICSQLVDQCYLDAGVHLFADGRWPGYVTPADLYNRLR
jgi:uncharacterized protein YycO